MTPSEESPRLAESDALLQQLRIDPHQRDELTDPRRGRWIAGGFALIAALATGAAAILMRRDLPVEIETATAVRSAASERSTAVLQASGYVTARRQATVSTQITGMLTEVLIEEGDNVTAGQPLARLDNTAHKASLAQIAAQLEAAQALLGQHDAQFAQARRDLKRNEDLVARQLVSNQALEASRVQVETFLAQVKSQHKQIELFQAALRGAEVQLAYTTVRAPFSGVVVAKTAQPGEIISPVSAGGGFTRTGVATIVDMDSLEIEVDINEAHLNRVTPHQLAQATLDAYPDWNIPAHVIAIIPTADRNKATVKVRIGIDEKDSRILPDMGVRVSFLEGRPNGGEPAHEARADNPRSAAVLIPVSGIVERAGRNVVFLVDHDRARAQLVTVGQIRGDLRFVEGIANGSIVVRAPPVELQDGTRVVIKRK